MFDPSYWTSEKYIDLYWNIAIELLGGLIISIIFLLLLRILKPKIHISPKIAYTKHTDEDGNPFRKYKIKFYNRSWAKATDIQMKLYLCTSEPSPGGKNLKLQELTLTDTYMWELRKFENTKLRKRFKWKYDEFARYAKQVAIKEDLNKIWTDHDHLEFKIHVKHSLSGFTRIISEQYTSKHSIKHGAFKSGNMFEINELDSEHS